MFSITMLPSSSIENGWKMEMPLPLLPLTIDNGTTTQHTSLLESFLGVCFARR